MSKNCNENNDLWELHRGVGEFELRRIDVLSFDPYDMHLPMILSYDTLASFVAFSDRLLLVFVIIVQWLVWIEYE